MEVLLNYSWPGNIRELENAIERACVTSRDPVIQVENLPPEIVCPAEARFAVHHRPEQAAHRACPRGSRPASSTNTSARPSRRRMATSAAAPASAACRAAASRPRSPSISSTSRCSRKIRNEPKNGRVGTAHITQTMVGSAHPTVFDWLRPARACKMISDREMQAPASEVIMLNFCPTCGSSIGQNQVAGQAVMCNNCGRVIGVATEGPKKVVVDKTEELIKGGTVGRCRRASRLCSSRGPTRPGPSYPIMPPGRKRCALAAANRRRRLRCPRHHRHRPPQPLPSHLPQLLRLPFRR